MFRTLPSLLAFYLISLCVLRAFSADEKPYGIEKRTPWTTSKIIGSPEPPLPFTTEKTLTNQAWNHPLYVAREPGTRNVLLVEQGGEKEKPSRIWRVPSDPSTPAKVLLEVSERIIYSIQFHPGYVTNGYLFVFNNGPTPRSERTNHVSRFLVDRSGDQKCDPTSELKIISWHSQGHDGGGMVFAPDGMFYVSTGDGTSDSDGWDSAQDVSNLLGSVLRLDLDHPAPGQAYSVPKDNPFVTLKDARPEVWAYGLRNPWRMTIDEKAGQIWAGINGQDLWETAQIIRKGENYGWSVYGGSHPFYLNRRRGPTPIALPTIEHSHSEMRSLTGGIVYYGKEFPELDGVYLYGDYSSGQIWGARHDGKKLRWHKKLAQTQIQIAGFGLDADGHILIVDHGAGIHRLTRSPREKNPPKFPTFLSQTGIFSSTRDHTLAPGVIPYSVNASAWMDGAAAERFLGLPGRELITFNSGHWEFTNGTVFAQTLSLSNRHLETRLLTKQAGQWAGYTYRWNAAQTDATLVPKEGAETTVVNGTAKESWRFPSRDDCMNCHSRAANFILGFTSPQLQREHNYGSVRDDQIRTLTHLGLFAEGVEKREKNKAKLVNPYDEQADREARARAFLHVNCSVCHVEAGGGNAKMELGLHTALDKMNLIGARPQHDSFGIPNAMLVFPGDADKSVLIQRVSRRGQGQMPPLWSRRVDEQSVRLLRDWINAMPPQQQFVKEWTMEELSAKIDRVKSGRSISAGKTAFDRTGCAQCHRFQGTGGSVGPDLTDVAKRLSPEQILESILLPSKVITEGFTSTEIETKSGDASTGVVEREDRDAIFLRPTAGTEGLLRIAKKEVDRRSVSRVSNMPAGIANTLQEAEIFDLIAYLLAPKNIAGRTP